MTVPAWLAIGMAVCMALAGCSQPPGPSEEATTAVNQELDSFQQEGSDDADRASALDAEAWPAPMLDGIEFNITGPVALRLAIEARSDQSCQLVVALEYRTPGHGLSFMAIHQESTGRGTGQGMSTQETVANIGPIDTRKTPASEEGASRVAWSTHGGQSTLIVVLLHAEANPSEFVANGSILVQSDCDGANANLTHAGNQVNTWHAQTLNGTAIFSHAGWGALIDRGIKAKFAGDMTVLAAFHTGDAFGELEFQGPGLNRHAILPVERLVTAEGGPGTYQTTMTTGGGSRIWGFMAGMDSVLR